MEKGTLSPIQLKLLNILRWFHGYCVDNDLTYYAVGGTLIGAMRHNGFIPWDDDIDIAMPRPDYEKFIQMTKDSQFGNYIVESLCDKNYDFTYLYAKIYDASTTLVENRRYRIRRGLFLDIYPIDGVGQSLEEGLEFYRPLEKKLDFLACRVSAWRKGRSLFKNIAALATRLIPNSIYPILNQLISIDQYSKQLDYSKCEYVGPLYGLHRFEEVVPKEYFGKPQEHIFENMTIYIVEKPDKYLTKLYGDWRCLPTKEKQVSHHDFISLDIESSFMKEKVK